MDFTTLLGLIAGISVVALAVLSGSDASTFVNFSGLMIVLGGTFAATLIKFPISKCYYSFTHAIRSAFIDENEPASELIEQALKLAHVARKEGGLLALEDEDIKNPFFSKGIQLIVDGNTPEFVREVLTREMDLSIERHDVGEKIFRAVGESAPAFGMIGTLVGLVQMLSNLGDADGLGPGMAVALLTTLYGAMLAHLVALPIADKLQIVRMQVHNNKALIIDSVLSIQQGQHPRAMDEMLTAYLPDEGRVDAAHKGATASAPRNDGSRGE